MIVTVTLNPCLDKTIYLDSLKVGEYNRVVDTRNDLAGKGINVSTVIRNLGGDTLCTGFNFRDNGADLEKVFEARGLDHDFVMCDGAIRTNTKLFDRSSGVMTEINESGPLVAGASVDAFLAKIDVLLDEADILVMSGSLPPGVPTAFYADLIRLAHAKGVKAVLDSAGAPFESGLEALPDLIKPNLYEFGLAFSRRLGFTLNDKPDENTDFEKIFQVAKEVAAEGIPYICISLGGGGAVLINAEHAYRAGSVVTEVQGLTGAGDSLVAGMCYALAEGMGPEEMLRYGIATSGASVRKPGTLLATGDEVRELLPQVLVETLE